MTNLRTSGPYGGIFIILATGLFLFALGIIPQIPPADPSASPVFYAFKNAFKDLFFYMGVIFTLAGVSIYVHEGSFGINGCSRRVRNEGGNGGD